MSYPIPLGKSILQLVCTSALSGYGLYLSYHNITRLQQYEKQSEKAAEWSNAAAHRLHKTRTTQTSGTISVLLPNPTLSIWKLTMSSIAPCLFPDSPCPSHNHFPCNTYISERSKHHYAPVHPHTHGEFLERIKSDACPFCAKVQ
jgi:hypothetical protein